MSYTSVTVEHIPGITTFVNFQNGSHTLGINALYTITEYVQVSCDADFPLPPPKTGPDIKGVHEGRTCATPTKDYLFCDAYSSVEDIKQLCLYFVAHRDDTEVADRLFDYAVSVARAMRFLYRPTVVCLPEMPNVPILTH